MSSARYHNNNDFADARNTSECLEVGLCITKKAFSGKAIQGDVFVYHDATLICLSRCYAQRPAHARQHDGNGYWVISRLPGLPVLSDTRASITKRTNSIF